MSGMRIVEFLEARIAEDEQVARKAYSWTRELRSSLTRPDEGGVVAFPSRVLAECAAKRRIIELHTTGGGTTGRPGEDAACSGAHDPYPAEAEDCYTLRALAAVYADHDDYNASWAVEA